MNRSPWPHRFLLVGAVANGVAILLTGYMVISPSLAGTSTPETPSISTVPAYDYTVWHALPVQHGGRIKPLDSFAREAVRQITGRTKFEAHDPVAMVLAWWLTAGQGATGFTNWEAYPFILCDHPGLREGILQHRQDAQAELLHAKRIAPADLRSSPGFDLLLAEVSSARQRLQGKAHLELDAIHLKAEEVGRRLVLYDQICGRAITRLHTNALSSDQFIDVPQLGAVADLPAEVALAGFEKAMKKHPDPLLFVGLRCSPDRAWFSLGQLRAIRSDTTKWKELVDEQRRDDQQTGLTEMAGQPWPEMDVLLLFKGFDKVIEAYRTENAAQFADASNESREQIQVTTSWALLQGRETDFAALQARRAWVLGDREALRQWTVSPSPATNTIELELAYNRCQPFLWAWIAMLTAAIVLFVALMTSYRVAYFLGILLYVVSLAIQAAGFYARVSISGWAPVTNMYESVIFAAFAAGVLALVLELIYRRTVIALAGSAVATLGLILADQLPLALDPKISPMVPVLRTNYWLTIHVLTIVCGYAAGVLAWGLGNVSLALLAFGKGSEENLKMLARFTYRAMQLTVLFLATGTFLGGWWAAEAWGRFWGWDPKEVGALIALVCYVIPLHARYIGWVKEFGLAIAAVLCFAAILVSWYVVNFVIAAGLHSYGFGGGGGQWVLLAGLVNLEWVLIATLLYRRKQRSTDEGRPGSHG